MNQKLACVIGGIAVLVVAAGVVTAVVVKNNNNKDEEYAIEEGAESSVQLLFNCIMEG